MRTLAAEPLTPEAFAPYGEVIFADPAKAMDINYGNTVRFDHLAEAVVGSGKAILSLFRSIPLEPLELKIMERHPLGSQAFVPLNGRPYLVVVAPPGDLDETKIRAFLAGPNQGVNYAPGVWHHFLLAQDEVSDFLVVDRLGPEDNCDEVALAQSLTISV
jgi:ureidoglycolate lyase